MKFGYLTLLLLICSCATPDSRIKNFSKYQKEFLPKNKFANEQEIIEGKTLKIVVLAFDENKNTAAIQDDLGNSIANNVENILSKNHLGEIVDRKAVSKLRNEIALAELKKTGSYKGPLVADYVISGTILEDSSYVNERSGRRFSTVAGILKIYQMPSLSIVGSAEFSAKKSSPKQSSKTEGVRIATEYAITDIETKIKNFFTKKSYILEKRSFQNHSIFKISSGSNDGLKQGDKFEIISQSEDENAITNQMEKESIVIGTGVVSNLINPKTSWVLIDDSEKCDLIRLGDEVTMQYTRTPQKPNSTDEDSSYEDDRGHGNGTIIVKQNHRGGPFGRMGRIGRRGRF
ncbi:MAG: hypothetical protein V4694_05415 [Pseudomonadota bacterium]